MEFMRNALENDLLKKLSGSRLLEELQNIIFEPNPSVILKRALELGVLTGIFGECTDVEKLKKRYKKHNRKHSYA